MPAATGWFSVFSPDRLKHEEHKAKSYRRQCLLRSPSGYCGIGGTALSRPIGLNAGEA
jgi:hypothetical protein